jgi:hypothetical protein
MSRLSSGSPRVLTRLRRATASLILLVAALHAPETLAQMTLTATFHARRHRRVFRQPQPDLERSALRSLNITSIEISQNSSNGAWGGSQGNDTSVNVEITFSNASTVSFAGAINWVRNAGGGVFHWVGITTNQAVADGYTTSGGGFSKTYILQFDQSALDLSTLLPDNLDGSANAGQALTALNTYVPPPVTFTNTNATSGG